MNKVLYRLPDSAQIVQAVCLWEEKQTSLLFVSPVEGVSKPMLVIAERRADLVYEDSTANTFPLEDWSASMISVYLMLLVKENACSDLAGFN